MAKQLCGYGVLPSLLVYTVAWPPLWGYVVMWPALQVYASTQSVHGYLVMQVSISHSAGLHV